MIGVISKSYDADKMKLIAQDSDVNFLRFQGRSLFITPAGVALPDSLSIYVEDIFDSGTDAQLSSPNLFPKRSVAIGDVEFSDSTLPLVLGPCSIESKEQIVRTVDFIAENNLNFVRGSAFKPRTTPYGFQGLGRAGLEMLREQADRCKLKVISETRDSRDVEEVIELADVVQVGAKAMFDYAILEKVGQSKKPVLLKRGFGSTIQEFLQIAEYILLHGNPNVILCERGIRTFENKSRFTLDIAGAIYLLHHANIPLVIDPSHAMGKRYGVNQLGLAGIAAGADGLIVEMHPDPDSALTDAAQQINFDQARGLISESRALARMKNRELI